MKCKHWIDCTESWVPRPEEQPVPTSSNKFDEHGESLVERVSSSPSTTQDPNFESYAEIFNEPRRITWEKLSHLF